MRLATKPGDFAGLGIKVKFNSRSGGYSRAKFCVYSDRKGAILSRIAYVTFKIFFLAVSFRPAISRIAFLRFSGRRFSLLELFSKEARIFLSSK